MGTRAIRRQSDIFASYQIRGQKRRWHVWHVFAIGYCAFAYIVSRWSRKYVEDKYELLTLQHNAQTVRRGKSHHVVSIHINFSADLRNKREGVCALVKANVEQLLAAAGGAGFAVAAGGVHSGCVNERVHNVAHLRRHRLQFLQSCINNN